MPSNVTANAGSGGSSFCSGQISFDGDTVQVPGNFLGILSGSEDAYTFSLVVGGAGAVSGGVQRMTLASNDPAVTSLQLIDDTIGTVGAALPTKAQVWGVATAGDLTEIPYAISAATLGQDTISFVGTYHMANATFGYYFDGSGWDRIRGDSTDGMLVNLGTNNDVNPQPHTAGGLSIFRSLDLDETEEDVKTAAGQVYSAWVTNFATTTRYLKFYNDTAANVVVGTTTPKITIAIPGNTTDDISAILTGGGYGIAFDTAICVAATTGLADADTGAPAANDVCVNIFYK